MRILFVTPYVPSRIRVRPFNLIKSLSALHDISLVSLQCEAYERELVTEVAQFCVSVDLVPLPRRMAYGNCLLALPTPVPLRVAYYRSPALLGRMRQVIREREIELVHGELIKVFPALQAVQAQAALPVLYDSVDCISWYLQQQWYAARSPLRKAFVYTELQKMRRYERLALRAFDRVVITAQHDADRLRALGEDVQHIEVVPNGVDTSYFTAPVSPAQTDSLVFCAKLDYYPNAQAIVAFCRETLPLIWEQSPRVRLTIVGNNPPREVVALGLDGRITVTGSVPDVRPYLGRAAVALAPLQIAAGMQNKVLEAMAMGLPVVATAASCRSLGVKHGRELLVAEGGRANADAVLGLLANRQLAHELGRAGRRYVELNHSWEATAQRLSELYQALLEQRDQRAQARHSVLAL
jgi:sugar transferase (PEP-CTERM/EpsH1 system associated)